MTAILFWQIFAFIHIGWLYQSNQRLPRISPQSSCSGANSKKRFLIAHNTRIGEHLLSFLRRRAISFDGEIGARSEHAKAHLIDFSLPAPGASMFPHHRSAGRRGQPIMFGWSNMPNRSLNKADRNRFHELAGSRLAACATGLSIYYGHVSMNIIPGY